MGLENVEKAVLAEARAEAEEIAAEARSSLNERVAAAGREMDERFEARHKREMARLQSEHNRELSRARTDARLAVLKEKNAVIEKAFAGALEKLAELPEEKFLALAGKWLREVPADLEGRIATGERERAMLSGAFIEKINAGRSGKLTLSDEAGPVGGGLVVRAEKFEFDFSWAGRLADRKGALAPEVAAILFGKEG
jgi:V/A-type H+/Na+-transporting ATPase subunit E